MTYTPGPWRWSPFGTLSTTAKISATCDNVVVWSQRFGFDNEDDKALIAAAPDLLVACQALTRANGEHPQTEAALIMAERAIEKAQLPKRNGPIQYNAQSGCCLTCDADTLWGDAPHAAGCEAVRDR